MPDTLEREDQEQEYGGIYDRNGAWKTNVGSYDWDAGEKDVSSKSSGEYDSDNPSSKAKKDPDVKNAESAAGADSGSGIKAPALANERSNLGQKSWEAGKALGEASKNGRLGAMGRVRAVMQTRPGRAGGVAGIVTAIIIAIFAIATGSTEMISIKENFIGRGNISQNFSMRNRHARSTFMTLRKIANLQNAEQFLADADKLNTRAMKSKLQRAGFTLTEDANGKVASIATELSDGTPRSYTFAAGNANGELTSFLDDIAGDGARKLEKVANPVMGKWKGPFPRSAYTKRLTSSLKSWLSGKESDPSKTPEENAKATAAASEAPEVDIPEERGGFADLNETDENGKPINEVSDASEVADDIEGAADNTIKDVADEIGGLADNAAPEIVSERLQRAVVKAGVTSLKASVFSALDFTAWAQIVCKAKGTLQWVANIRNILLTIELTRGALRYLNAADSQKSGVLTGEAIQLYLNFFRMGSPTGSYASSPGVRYATGDRSVRVSDSSLTQFSTGRSNAGALGVISNFINNLPGVNSNAFRSSCSLVNNGWFQAGSLVVGVVAAIFTLGGSAEVSFGSQAFLIAGAQAAITLTIEIGGPLLARTGQHAVMNELKDTLSKGDALGAGLGALSSMNGSTNSMLLATKQQATALRSAALANEKEYMKTRGAFDRYLSMDNADSLVSRLAFSSPRSLPEVSKIATTAFATAINPLSSLGRLSGTAYAASSDQCTDERLADYATDPFCNPEVSIAPSLDLDQTRQLLFQSGHIDAKGVPISKDFKDFIKHCASGQPTLVYNTEIDKNGSSVDEIENCVTNDGVLAGETTPASEAYAYIYDSQPEPSFVARLLGKRAYAADVDARLVSQRERFAAWQGLIVDTSSIVEDVNEQYEELPASGAPGTSVPSSVNAQGLNGYTIPCTGLPATPKLVGSRPDAINWDSIPDSGTIGLASDGAPIKVYIREPCNNTNVKTVILASSIHGTENEGQDISFELLFKKTLPANMRVIAIPEINHAGLNNDPGRVNANGVNLNRNFSFNWTTIQRSADNNYSGPAPDSEPETKAVQTFLRSVNENNLFIAYHDNIHYVVAVNTVGLPASKAYFNYIVSKGVGGFTNTGGIQNSDTVRQTGSMDAWYAETMSKPTMLVELKSTTTDTEVGIHADAIINLVSSGVL